MTKFVQETEFSVAGSGRDVVAFAWSPDSRQLAAFAGLLREATVFEVPSGKKVAAINDLVGGVHDIQYAPDGRVLAAASTAKSQALTLWNPKTGEKSSISGPNAASGDLNVNMLKKFVVSLNGTRLAGTYAAALGLGVEIRTAVYDARTWDLLSDYPIGATGITISPDGARFAVIGRGGTEIYETGTGALQLHFVPTMNPSRKIDWSPDGRRIVTGVGTTTGFGPDPYTDKPGRLLDEENKVLQLWDANTGTRVESTSEHLGFGVESLEFSRDGRWLVTTTADGTCRLWDAKTLALRQIVAEKLHPTTALARFSPDSQRLAVVRTGLARATIYRLR